jgi:uncharacterized BrkB/YihY/UPF0761 family membrane protein
MAVRLIVVIPQIHSLPAILSGSATRSLLNNAKVRKKVHTTKENARKCWEISLFLYLLTYLGLIMLLGVRLSTATASTATAQAIFKNGK